MKINKRILFSGHSQQDKSASDELLQSIDDWWSAFRDNCNEIVSFFEGRSSLVLPEFMHDHLGAVDERLMWEFGPAAKGQGHRLVVTPEANAFLRPLVNLLIERAPDIKGWEFYPYRLPEDAKDAISFVEQRTGTNIGPWKVLVSKGQFNLVCLTYIAPGAEIEPAFIATETILGEEVLDKWIGCIEAQPLAAAKDDGVIVPILGLNSAVDKMVSEIKQQVAKEPFTQRVSSLQWATFQCDPNVAPEFVKQRDLVVGVTADVGVYSAANGPARFYSERFSQAGELFCFVCVEDKSPISEEKLYFKTELDDALGEALFDSGSGCVIGSGTGLEHLYLDLALVENNKGVELVRRVLSSRGVPKSTWILFYDSTLEAEWIGIYEDTPPPMSFLPQS